MAESKSRSWKMERASVSVNAKSRPRSNKYAKSDTDAKPAPRSRHRVWVGAYERSDGTKVPGHYRGLAGHGSGNGRR